jgi:recombination protein RecT
VDGAVTELALRRDDLVEQIRRPEFREQVKLALPENVSVDRFTRATATAILENPDLLEADRASLFQSVIRCAQMGLMPDGRQAAIVVFKTKAGDKWIKKAQSMPMIGGMRDIAAESGWMLRARAVYANDRYEYSEEPQTLVHQPPKFGEDRGELIGAWALAIHRDGRRMQREMSLAEINQRRAVAKTDNVWKQWPAEMAEKTVAKDLWHDLPFDPGDKRIATLEDAEPATLMYGPAVESQAPVLSRGGASLGRSLTGADEGQAGAENPVPSASAPAVGPDDDEVLDYDGEEIPFGEPEPEPDDELGALRPPRGKYSASGGDPSTLTEILEKNPRWLNWALANLDQPFRGHVEEFMRERAPEQYQAAMAEREVS